MSRSAIDRRQRANWPVQDPAERLSTASTTRTSRLLAFARSIRQDPTSQRTPAMIGNNEIELPVIEPAKPVQRKPVPRGPTERGRFSGMVEMLNEDRIEPGEVLPAHEPKSHFDWESDNAEPSKVFRTGCCWIDLSYIPTDETITSDNVTSLSPQRAIRIGQRKTCGKTLKAF